MLSRCGWAALSFSLKCVFFLLSSISQWRSLYYLHDSVTGVWRWSRHLLPAFIKNNVFRTTGMQGVLLWSPDCAVASDNQWRTLFQPQGWEACSLCSFPQTDMASCSGWSTHPGHRSTDLGTVSARMWPVFPLLPEMCVFLWDNHSSPVNNLKHLHCCCFNFYKKRWTHDDVHQK